MLHNDIYYPEDCIAALATPWGTGALGIIRTSGNGTIQKMATCFSPSRALQEASGHSVIHGTLFDPVTRESLDDILAAVFRAPKSYTGEDSVELTVHGSMAGVQRILHMLFSIGFRRAGPGEFTLRAFINRKMDLTRAEAVNEIVSAKSARAHSMALHRLGGTIERRINEVKKTLTDVFVDIELQLDYSDDEPEASDTPIDTHILSRNGEIVRALIDSYNVGKVYQEGIMVVLAGKTNAGKSSLFNLFLKEDRSIVSEVHGTTRDYIESWITIEGIPIKLYDTAGLRLVDHPVEIAGIKRSEDLIAHADVILYLIDATVGMSEEDRAFLEDPKVRERTVAVWNKTDKNGGYSIPEGVIPLSSTTGDGFTAIEKEITGRAVDVSRLHSGEPVIDSLRQKELLERCLDSIENAEKGTASGAPLDMIAVDIREAVNALGEITGEVTSMDILDNMFSKFCVGK